MAEKILIVEDEAAIQALLKNFLEDAGYEVDLADDGLEGISKFQRGQYGLILLDVMIPKIDGYVVLEMIRKESDIPVIMITAMEQEKNQMKAFDLGADDYIVKPFTLGVVLKRIEAVLRRIKPVEESKMTPVIRCKDLTLDINSCEVFVSGKSILLTNKEYELLKLLLENQNQVFSREFLLEKLWGYDFYGNPKVINFHIQNLRRKLGGEFIEAVRGVGYKIGK